MSRALFEEVFALRNYEAEEHLSREKEKFFSFVRTGDFEKMKSFLKENPQVLTMTSNLRENALHDAVRADKPEMIAYLLAIVPEDQKDSFLNARDNEGFTPLMRAVEQKTNQ